MPPRCRPVDIGAERGRAIVGYVLAEARRARLDRGLSQDDVAQALGMSRTELSRLERGCLAQLTIDRAARWLAILGLELSVRAYATGHPLRDAAHLALLERLRGHLHSSLRWRTEVPMPIAADRRAWDAVIAASSWTLGVEAETRPLDLQALERRVALKIRDSGTRGAILVLADTRHNRALLRAGGDVLRAAFPVAGHRALELLHVGLDPGGSAVVLA